MKCRLPWCNYFVVIKRYYDVLFSGVPISCLNLGSRHTLIKVPEVFPTFLPNQKQHNMRQIGAQSQRAACFVKVAEYSFRARRYECHSAHAHAQGLQK